MAKQLNAKFLGLVTALVIGLGGAVALPSAVHAADPAPVGLDLSGLTTTIDNTTGAVTGTVDTTLGDTTGSVTGTVDSTAGAVTGTVDATLGTGTGSASADGSAAAGSTSTSGSASVDATAGTTGTTATDPVSSVVDTVTGVLDGSSTGGSGGSTDPVTNVVDGVTGVLDSGTTGGASESVANVVNNVASIPVGDNATVGSSVDSTADSVTTTVDPVVAPVIDSCVNLPPAGVSVDLGSSCGGGSGILDPITTAVAPVTDPLANVCLSAAGVDAQAGSTCTGSGGGSGSGDLLGPVTSVVDQGTSTLTPVLGDLSLPSVDTQPVTDTVNQVVNPLDACASVNPLNLNEALGAGCDQPTAPCTTLNVNCLLTSVTDPVIGPGGALDPVLDACLGYDPLGFNLDIGSVCAASTPPPTTCPPDCGTTCPPDCGTTCPPDCGPPVCICSAVPSRCTRFARPTAARPARQAAPLHRLTPVPPPTRRVVARWCSTVRLLRRRRALAPRVLVRRPRRSAVWLRPRSHRRTLAMPVYSAGAGATARSRSTPRSCSSVCSLLPASWDAGAFCTTSSRAAGVGSPAPARDGG